MARAFARRVGAELTTPLPRPAWLRPASEPAAGAVPFRRRLAAELLGDAATRAGARRRSRFRLAARRWLAPLDRLDGYSYDVVLGGGLFRRERHPLSARARHRPAALAAAVVAEEWLAAGVEWRLARRPDIVTLQRGVEAAAQAAHAYLFALASTDRPPPVGPAGDALVGSLDWALRAADPGLLLRHGEHLRASLRNQREVAAGMRLRGRRMTARRLHDVHSAAETLSGDLLHAAGLLRRAARDFTGADLRFVDLDAFDLEGVWWDWGTRWPSTQWARRMEASSDPVPGEPGTFVVVRPPTRVDTEVPAPAPVL